MDKITRAVERKTNKITGTRNLKPTNNRERQHRTTLAIFDTMMRFEAEVQQQGLTGQDRARLADDMAVKVSQEIRKVWTT